MLRKARMDAPAALHHIIARGIVRKKVFDEDRYAYCGHGVLMGQVTAEWQNAGYVTRFFDKHLQTARRRYRDFVQKGISEFS